jgi:hypothetical protein
MAASLTVVTCRDVYPTTATNVDVLVTFEAPASAAENEGSGKRKKGASGAASAAAAAPAAPAVYLACALDVSGSMSGQKLSELKQTMLYMSSTL